ncbi:MAG: HhH-GPD-type base excision DNA repair protein [Mycobacteriales bacterium]
MHNGASAALLPAHRCGPVEVEAAQGRRGGAARATLDGMTTDALQVTGDPASDQLISTDPLALLMAMLLDQQIPMEKAFRGPAVLRERLGSLDPVRIAEHPDLAGVFAAPPAIHRFPGSMATRVQQLCRTLVAEYDGDAAAVWTGVGSGTQLLSRLEALPGFGRQKAQIFVALLGKRRGVRPRGWRAAAGPYGDQGAYRSVADVTSPDSLQKVRAFKQAAKAAAKADAPGTGASR